MSPWFLLLLSLFVVAAGCDGGADRFEPNRVYARNQKLGRSAAAFQANAVRQRMEDIERVVEQFFGDPNEPRLPPLEDHELDSLFDLELLRMAAGPVVRSADGSARGLYRQWCVHCHGISGDGRGVRARRLDPYPRDYRRGIFKFKRTPSTLPPTPDDLRKVLVRGVPDTAMPSFDELSDVEREALVQYVRYLSVRGMAERAIIAEVAFELSDDERLADPALLQSDPAAYEEQIEWMLEVVEQVVEPWRDVEGQSATIPARPADYGTAESVARGRELFFTTLTNCATCHGNTALGDGQTEDYDEWAKELDPTHPALLRDYLALGALAPRPSIPRDLRQEIYRGGERPEDLFLRIRHGIAGTTMPSVATQLRDDDIWHLVAYSLDLPFDPLLDFSHEPGAWPTRSVLGLSRPRGIGMSVALIASGVFFWVALRAARRGNRRSVSFAALLALILGGLSLGLRVDEMRRLRAAGIPLGVRGGAIHAQRDLYYLHAVRERLTDHFRGLETKRVEHPDPFSPEDQARLELVGHLRDYLVSWTEEEIGHWLDDPAQRQSLIDVVADVIHPVEERQAAVAEAVRRERQELPRRATRFRAVREYCDGMQALYKERRTPGSDDRSDAASDVISWEEREERAERLRAELRELGVDHWPPAESALADADQPLLIGERLTQIDNWLHRMQGRLAFLDAVVEPQLQQPPSAGLNRQHAWLKLPVSFPHAPDWAARYVRLAAGHLILVSLGAVILVVVWYRSPNSPSQPVEV